MSNSELSILMQRLSKAIEKLSSKDIQLILSDSAEVDISVKPVQVTAKPEETISNGVSIDFSAISAQLDRMESRASGSQFLKNLTKLQLQELAKRFSVSVDSGASKERIVEKIVERKIGLRLRQNAFSQVMQVA
jgi:hypothetical protein